jgi:hypothetical protein
MSYGASTSASLVNQLRSDIDSLVLRIATLQDQKNTGVNGGASVAGVWTTRALNAIHSDPYDVITSLSGNLFTVEAGEYQIRVITPFHATLGTRTRIWDVTNDVLVGYSVSTYVFNQTNVYLYQTERIQPHKTTTYRLDYYTEQAKSDGLGIATNTGDIEVYTVLDVVDLHIRTSTT